MRMRLLLMRPILSFCHYAYYLGGLWPGPGLGVPMKLVLVCFLPCVLCTLPSQHGGYRLGLGP